MRHVPKPLADAARIKAISRPESTFGHRFAEEVAGVC